MTNRVTTPQPYVIMLHLSSLRITCLLYIYIQNIIQHAPDALCELKRGNLNDGYGMGPVALRVVSKQIADQPLSRQRGAGLFIDM